LNLFFNQPTFFGVGIKARPIEPLVNSLFNKPEGENYACSVAKVDTLLYIITGRARRGRVSSMQISELFSGQKE
jgi:hypothetical protein